MSVSYENSQSSSQISKLSYHAHKLRVRTTGFRSYPRLYFEMVLVGFAVVMGLSLMAAFLPILAEELDPSGVLVGFTVSAFFLSRLFIEVPAGIISDRIGRRKLLIAGIGLTAIGAFLCARADSIYVLIAGRAFWGLGTALYFMNNAALIIDLFHSKMRGRALGMFNSIEFLGGFVGAPVGALLAGAIGHAGVFYVALVMVLASFVLAVSSRSLRSTKNMHASEARASVGQTIRYVRDWGIVSVFVITFFRMLVMQGVFATVLQLYLNGELLFPEANIGLILSLRIAGHVLAAFSSGFVAERFGKKPTMLAGFLIDAGCLAAFTSIFSLEAFLAVGFFEGFGEGLVFTSLIVLLSDLSPPTARGGILGFYRTFMDLGGFAGPILLVLVYASWSSHAPFWAAVLINLMNVLLLVAVKIKPAAND